MLTRIILLILVCFSIGCDGEPGALDGPVAADDASEEVSERLCYYYEDCGCGELAGVSLDGCEIGLGFSWQSRREDAKQNGLTYDGDCLSKRLNAMRDRGCAVTSTSSNLFCGAENCQIFHGSLKKGEMCEGSPTSSDCEQGLQCQGTCETPCSGSFAISEEGESCVDTTGVPSTLCVPGSFCDTTSGVCSAPIAVGEPCLTVPCVEGALCLRNAQEMMVCTEIVADGESCLLPSNCISQICTDGLCGETPGPGDTCSASCVADHVCTIVDGTTRVCKAKSKLGESCDLSMGAVCVDELSSIGGTCVTTPGNGESCDGGDGTILPCSGDLICSAKVCESGSSLPGCNCGDQICFARVCSPIPPGVCGDSGGLLF